MTVQGARNLWGQRFSAYFVLKVAPQRGEGEKRRECKFPKIAHRTFDPINSWPPVHAFSRCKCYLRIAMKSKYHSQEKLLGKK